jgi:hypothetical protein
MFGANHWPLWSGELEDAVVEGPGSISHHEGAWSIRTRERKLIVTIGKVGELAFELFDLQNDVDERINIASKHPRVVAKMFDDLMQRISALGVSRRRQWQLRPDGGANPNNGSVPEHPSPTEIDATVQEQLRALGYIDNSP